MYQLYIYILLCSNCKICDYLNPNIIKYYNNLSIRKKIENDKSKKDIYNEWKEKKDLVIIHYVF